ncbi:hypothetical protein ACFYZ4_31810 [Streptomyces sp. NPDC001513]
MHPVVDHVAGHHQAEVRHVQHRAAVAVRVPHFDDVEVVSFEARPCV